MRAIVKRLRRLDDAQVLPDQDRAIVEAILATRPRRLGLGCVPLAPDSVPTRTIRRGGGTGCAGWAKHCAVAMRPMAAIIRFNCSLFLIISRFVSR